jgi:hypothetical protein
LCHSKRAPATRIVSRGRLQTAKVARNLALGTGTPSRRFRKDSRLRRGVYWAKAGFRDLQNLPNEPTEVFVKKTSYFLGNSPFLARYFNYRKNKPN